MSCRIANVSNSNCKLKSKWKTQLFRRQCVWFTASIWRKSIHEVMNDKLKFHWNCIQSQLSLTNFSFLFQIQMLQLHLKQRVSRFPHRSNVVLDDRERNHQRPNTKDIVDQELPGDRANRNLLWCHWVKVRWLHHYNKVRPLVDLPVLEVRKNPPFHFINRYQMITNRHLTICIKKCIVRYLFKYLKETSFVSSK